MPLQLRNSKFTIIEMIWVIVVIAIILGMGAAAMTGIGTHKGTEGGARMMARMLELSRQYAISQNSRVALIMPMSDASTSTYQSGDHNYHSDTWSRDFSLYMPDPSDCATNDTPGIMVRPAIVNKNNEFIEWVKGTEWVRIPGGVYFSGNYPSDPAKLGIFECAEINNVHMPNVGGYVTTNVSVHGLVFKSTGSTTQVEDAIIEVKPYSVNSVQTDFDPGSASVYELSVNWLTGKITTTQKKKIDGRWRTVE